MTTKFQETIQEVEKNLKFNTLKKTLRWTAIITGTLAISALVTLSAYAVASRYDSSLTGLRLQNPIQSPLRFDQQESFLKAPRDSRIVLNAQAVVKPTNDPKAH